MSNMQDIRFPSFAFDSPLASTIIELERARGGLVAPARLPPLFAELRELFQHLTSMLSARIEGNRTTVVDALEGAARADRGEGTIRDDVREILQLDRASEYIDECHREGQLVLSHKLVRELHQLAVDGLHREGDATPGEYRTGPVSIAGTTHEPPGPESVFPDMDQLLEFINREVAPQQQLMQVAIAHHRFVWIHPFGNGNGRVSRLLTYAMLVDRGFTGAGYRALNPTTAFGADRQAYYDQLSRADALDDEGTIQWCRYVLDGVKHDLNAIHQLNDPQTVLDEVYVPALDHAHRSGVLSGRDVAVLARIAGLESARAGDIEDLVRVTPTARSQYIRKLLERGLIQRTEPKARSYCIKLVPNELTIFVVRRLDELGLLPSMLKDH